MITDLLQPEKKTHLKIKENAQKEVNVECSEKCLSDVKMALELILLYYLKQLPQLLLYIDVLLLVISVKKY